MTLTRNENLCPLCWRLNDLFCPDGGDRVWDRQRLEDSAVLLHRGRRPGAGPLVLTRDQEDEVRTQRQTRSFKDWTWTSDCGRCPPLWTRTLRLTLSVFDFMTVFQTLKLSDARLYWILLNNRPRTEEVNSKQTFDTLWLELVWVHIVNSVMTDWLLINLLIVFVVHWLFGL